MSSSSSVSGSSFFVDGEIHHHEAGSVPELVGKVAHRLAALREEAHVVSGRVAGDDVEAERVRAVGVDDLDGIDAVTGGLGHFLALWVADQAVDEHRVERDLLHMLAAGEDHARDPEEDDVVAP